MKFALAYDSELYSDEVDLFNTEEEALAEAKKRLACEDLDKEHATREIVVVQLLHKINLKTIISVETTKVE